MRQAYRILPVHTGDVSGVCSALYEMGGMVVMHDPSGCNSTYNTHDETRWYVQDSLIFLTGLCEADAVMGRDDKLIHDVVEAAKVYHPKFIALCNSPIPYLNGTDFEGISAVIEKETGIPVWYIPTNGMHDYVNGAGLAFEAVARQLEKVPVTENQNRKVNVLGFTPLDFAAEGTEASLRAFLERAGWTLHASWSMGDGVENIRRSAEAALNLVISGTGLRAAKYMEKSFGIPYVVGAPIGSFVGALSRCMERVVKTGVSEVAYAEVKSTSQAQKRKAPRVALIGEPVTMGSLAAALRAEGAVRGTVVICPTSGSEGLLRGGDVAVIGEEEIEVELAQCKVNGITKVIADPFYELILPAGMELVRLPHLAMSGRNYLRSIPNLLAPGWTALK